MRLARIHARRWRGLSNVDLDLNTDTPAVVLAGATASGKSSLLEIVAWSMFRAGLSRSAMLNHPSVEQLKEAFEVRVEFSLPVDPYGDIAPSLTTMNDPWDGRLIVEGLGRAAKGGEGSTILSHASAFRAADYIAEWSISAGGIADPLRSAVVGREIAVAFLDRTSAPLVVLDGGTPFPRTPNQAAANLDTSRHEAGGDGGDLQGPSGLFNGWEAEVLAAQLRLESDYFRLARAMVEDGQPIPHPPVLMPEYSNALSSVLPHLSFSRVDLASRSLVYTSAGRNVEFARLSRGEQVVAFGLGQLIRYRSDRGLVLLDDPETHLAVDTLERWIQALAFAVGHGQLVLASASPTVIDTIGPAGTVRLTSASLRRRGI